jgi:hypothetical protein
MMAHRWERWRRIRWSGNLKSVLLCRHKLQLWNISLAFACEINSVAAVLFVCRRSWWRVKWLPILDWEQSAVITQRTGVMNCPLTDVDFAEGSLRFIKMIRRRPGELFIIYNSFDPTQKGCFCVRALNPPFSKLTQTPSIRHIFLWGAFFFTHFHLIQWNKYFYNFHRHFRMINMNFLSFNGPRDGCGFIHVSRL